MSTGSAATASPAVATVHAITHAAVFVFRAFIDMLLFQKEGNR
jgi:hypothetical protein